MSHQVFVSYKYSDAWKTRDSIMRSVLADGHYYNGERGYNKLELADNSIKEYLKDMIFNTSVTVVVISPNVNQSNWVEWEIEYSLRLATRNYRQSKRNGIVCVIQGVEEPRFVNGEFRYVKTSNWAYDIVNGKRKLKSYILPPVIKANMQDTFGVGTYLGSYFGYLDSDESNLTYDDYCVVVAESTFLSNPGKYIEEAYNRAQNADRYNIKINCNKTFLF